jgi:hypothetical protein
LKFSDIRTLTGADRLTEKQAHHMSDHTPRDSALSQAVQAAMISTYAAAWNAYRAKEYLNQRLPLLLKDCPLEEVMPPEPAVAGPAVETLRHVLHEPVLADMLAHLLTVAIDRRRAPLAHPAFANMIRNLSADEARLLVYFMKDEPLSLISLRWDYTPESGKQGGKEILQNFSHLAVHAQCHHPLMAASYIDNLCRLGLVEIPPFFEYLDASYAAIEADPLVQSLIADIRTEPEHMAVIARKGLRLSALGRQFISVCLQ